MPAPASFDYAIVRIVPRVEREEFLNAGAILFCRTHRFLAARIAADPARIAAFAPGFDLAAVEEHLESIVRIAAGGPGAGPLGGLSQAERFHWLVAPRSTIIQVSPAHAGLCADPAAALEHLLATMVCWPPPAP